MKIPFDWKIINTIYNYETSRAKVIGGWIVSGVYMDSENRSGSLIFISDPNHEWEIE